MALRRVLVIYESARSNQCVLHHSRTDIAKSTGQFLCFLLVTRTGLEPMLPPWKGGVLTAWPTGHFDALFCAIYKKRITSCVIMVAAMRFELMTYRVWTDRSNQLSYAAIWLRRKDSNLRPSGYEPDELPSCSTPRYLSLSDDNLPSLKTALL